MNNAQNIFRKGSTTYYMSSLFFPPQIKKDVTTLYAYVRTADDFVDELPQQIEAFNRLKHNTFTHWDDQTSGDDIVDDFLRLAHEKNFQKAWVEAFLMAMEQDLHTARYETFDDLKTYMYGSAGVIGLMMSSIMGLPEAAQRAAELQGQAMQLINFIRDIREDLGLGRVYMPHADMKRFGVQTLESSNDTKHAFCRLVRFEIDRYREIQANAEQGYSFIPRSYLIPIKTAAQMYAWTADQIYKNPLIVFEKKLKPSKIRILGMVIKNYLSP